MYGESASVKSNTGDGTSYEIQLTTHSSCGKPQEAYHLQHNLSKHKLSRGPGTSETIMGWRWGTHPGKEMGPVEVLWDGDGVPPSPIWTARYSQV